MTSLLRRTVPSRGARLTGWGAARAHQTTDGADLMAPFGKDAAWLRERTGIESVCRIGDDESIVDLADAAAAQALAVARAPLPDVVIGATCSCAPHGVASLSERVGAKVAPSAVTADVNAACSGFVLALSSAADHVRAGSADTVLVVAAEQMSSMLDPSDLGTSILFGDGAGAAVVQACDSAEDGFGPIAWLSDGSGADLLRIPDGSTSLRMDGRAVFRWAVSAVPRLIHDALARARVSAAEIEIFVPHQANLRIIEPIRRAAGLLHTPLADDVRFAGNTSAASIPLALARLAEERDLRRKLALFVGFGAGLTAAAQVVQLP